MKSNPAHPPHDAGAPHARWTVVCLCAQWCGACREYESDWQQVAAHYPQLQFQWVDIEDEAHRLGDYDVENFPTVVVADGTRVRFAGALLPHADTLRRLLRSLLSQASADAPAVPADAQALAVSLGLLPAR